MKVCANSPELITSLAGLQNDWIAAAPLRRRAFRSFLDDHVSAPRVIRARLRPPVPLDYEAFEASERMRVEMDNEIFTIVPRDLLKRIHHQVDERKQRSLKRSLGPQYVTDWAIAAPEARIPRNSMPTTIDFDDVRWTADRFGEDVEGADVMYRDYQAAVAARNEAAMSRLDEISTGNDVRDVTTAQRLQNQHRDLTRAVIELDERFCQSVEQAYSAPLTAAWIRLGRAGEAARNAESLAPST